MRKRPIEKRSPARRHSWFWRVTLICASALCVAGWIWWKRGSFSQSTRPQSDVGARAAVSNSPSDAEIFSRYAGSTSCKTCHVQHWADWHGSHHALAERPINATLDDAAFRVAGPVRHGSFTSAVQRVNGRFEIVTAGLSRQLQTFEATRVIGHSPLRQFLIPEANGRLQVTELAYHPATSEWFDVFGDENRVPGEWGHWTGRGMTWNQMCAACHNTRLRKDYDSSNDRYATTMAEQSVGCESCHGPMAEHVKWQRQNQGALERRDPTVRRLNRERMLDVCGSCHARRGELTGEFEPGQPFGDHFRLSVPDDTDLYYADGQVRDENYEFTSVLSSKMFGAGVSCMDCHEPHSAKIRAPDNALCQRCHEIPIPPAPKIDALTHSHHAAGKGGDRCVDCHMPLTTYMQRHPRRDHAFTIPDPLLTKEHGIPNACNRCHTDRDADWALARMEQWYGTRMNRPTRARALTIAKARAGDRDALADLMSRTREESVGLWRASATRLLERWAMEPQVTAAILERVGDPDPLVRSEAAHALSAPGGAGDSKAENSLRFLLNDPVRSVRIEAAWALRRTIDTNSLAGRDLFQSLMFNSDQPAGSARLGVFHMDRGQPTIALPFWERAVKWDGHSAALRDGLAVCLSLLGKASDAVQQLREACRLEPRDGHYRYKLGLALNELGKLSEAVAALEEAVKLDGRLAEASYNLGLGYAALERLDEALEALSKAESVDARSARIPYARATVLARLGRTAEARAAAQRALELQPDHRDALALLRQLR